MERENFEKKVDSVEVNKHKHLQDIRTFNNYMDNVVKYGFKEKEYFELFVKLIEKMNFKVKNIKERGCDKDKEFGVCLYANQVNDTPDFKLTINNRVILLEIKNSKYDLQEFHLKKFQIDNYVKFPSAFILWVMDCNGNPHFTLLIPEEIVKLRVWKNPKYGNKEVYCLEKKDYKWFKFNVSNELKNFIKEVLNLSC